MTDSLYLPFNNVYGLTHYDSDADLCLKPHVVNWCEENLGYAPTIIITWQATYQSWLQFQDPVDAALFKIQYAGYWIKPERKNLPPPIIPL